MTAELVLTLSGLALVDSVNISTMGIVLVLLLGAQRPAPTGWSYVTGAFATSFGVLLLLYFSASVVADSFDDLTLWMRRAIFAGLAIGLVALGIRKLKDRPRMEYQLPAWVNPWTAIGLGFLATIGDLPNSFPMFFATERIVDADVQYGTAIALLASYNLLYAVPTLVILIVGLMYHEQLRDRLQRAYDRHVGGVSSQNYWLVSVYFVGSLIALLALGVSFKS